MTIARTATMMATGTPTNATPARAWPSYSMASAMRTLSRLVRTRSLAKRGGRALQRTARVLNENLHVTLLEARGTARPTDDRLTLFA